MLIIHNYSILKGYNSKHESNLFYQLLLQNKAKDTC